MFTIVPTIGSKPSTGITLGAATSTAVFFGDPGTTRISSLLASVSISSKKQTSIGAKFDAFRMDNRVHISGDNRFQWTSQDTYGLGATTEPSDVVNTKFSYFRIYESAFYRLRGGLYIGAGVHFSTHTNIRPGQDADAVWDDGPYNVYTREHGFDSDSQMSAGIGVGAEIDTRDNPINASTGWLASTSYRPFFKGVLGGDSSWQEVLLDVRRYVKLQGNSRRTLAFWLYGDFVVNGAAPYFDLPAIGMDTYGRSGRGYAEGRFRGERLLYGELEYRATLTRNGLLGMVAFANTTTLSNLQDNERLFDSFAPAGGVGLRLLFNKRSRANLCVDYAWGKQGSHGLYLALQEAF